MAVYECLTEQHFATRRRELVAGRERKTDPGVWRVLNDAVAAQVGQWRAIMSAEIGTTPETELGLNTKGFRLRKVSHQRNFTNPLLEQLLHALRSPPKLPRPEISSGLSRQPLPRYQWL